MIKHQTLNQHLAGKPIYPILGILPYLASRGNQAGQLFVTEGGRALTWLTFLMMLDCYRKTLLRALTPIVSGLGQQLPQPKYALQTHKSRC